MKLIPDLFHPSCFTLLTAPVASGKTRMVVEFYRESDFKIIYLSPLRALANEVFANLQKNEEKNVFLAGGELALDQCLEKFMAVRKSFLVTTAELLSEEFIEELCNQEQKVLFVIDEFHLFYHWGEEFRPVLHDRFLAILNFYFPILAVTATMAEEVMNKMKKDLGFYQDFWIHLDYGNHQLHRTPERMLSFKGLKPHYIQKAFWREIRQKKDEEIFLYFCAYRSQVDEFVDRARRLGFKAVGCVGGEVDNFLEAVKVSEGKIDCIFSTTTLSHGVNLPEIRKVFIDYEVKNYDFWLQMIGRGGRQGSEYQVYTSDSFHTTSKERIKHKAKILLGDFLGVEMYIHIVFTFLSFWSRLVMKISSFEWDEGNLGKLRKRKISTAMVEDFFINHDLKFLNDHKHSFIESRFIAFGKYRDRDLFIAFTFRANSGILKIRIISARYVHEKEVRRLYEENNN